MKRRQFSNAIQYKLKNRRITVFRQENSIHISLRKLLSKGESSLRAMKTISIAECRGVIETDFCISYEAGIALYKALGEFIKLSDIPSELLASNKKEND